MTKQLTNADLSVYCAASERQDNQNITQRPVCVCVCVCVSHQTKLLHCGSHLKLTTTMPVVVGVFQGVDLQLLRCSWLF